MIGTSGTLTRPTLQSHLLDRLVDARRRTDELFAIVKRESLYERPIPERHRIVFYIGHLEAFDWNLLSERSFGLTKFQPGLDRLFAFGIDPVGGGLPDDRPSDWPSLEEVHGYASRIREILDDKIANASDDTVRGEFPLSQLLNVAIEHRLMHAETLAYMLHQLPFAHKIGNPELTPKNNSERISHRMIEIPAGRATLGLRRGDEQFGWDNEYELSTVDVPGFSIDKYEVTNGQYLEFMQAGGYESRWLWTEDDWKWRASHQISHPVFWNKNTEGWHYRGMFEDYLLPLNAPVYVSMAEARAYASWVGKALPTEAQWHRAAYANKEGGESDYPWGDSTPKPEMGNFDFASWGPKAVNAFPDGDSALGVSDLLGNGWEWTATEFAPLPGFKPFPFYRGYSADFFDGKHFVIKGGSPRTAACMLRRSFRNWFQPHYQYVYAGFRCVQR
ncbi:MAG TPA: SUMF1/EgtB/PvdO family nonheme iron enzyme [Candidatus Sulfotelmatobacter sp.]